MEELENKPKVSIIVPVYNVRKYLEDALLSVIHQTYKNLEIIIIDDGSNDGSEIICDEYVRKDNRIKVIHQKNGGLSAARNTGLDNATGEFIAFIDSDDIFHPEMIQRMLYSMLFYKADCVICRFIPFNANKKIKYKNAITKKKNNGKFYSRTDILKAVANDKIECYVWNKLYKKKLFENIKYPVGQNYEDLYIIFEILDKVKNIFILDDVLIFYRKHYKSIISTYSLKNFQDLQKAHNKFEQYVKNHTPEIFTKEELKNLNNRWLNLLLYKYAQILHKNIAEKKELLVWFKERINEQISQYEIKEYSLETQLICHILFNAPKIFSICAIFYPSIRKFISNFVKRIII